jgi:hypothetical protein
LANWASEMVVYVDEAGMDNREDYSYGWNEKGQRFHALNPHSAPSTVTQRALADGSQ